MRYKTEDYAKALAAAVEGKADEAAVRKNFLALLERTGDRTALPKILGETERILRRTRGERKVVIETARPLSSEARSHLAKTLKKSDAVEERTDPALVAGIRITMDDEERFDATLMQRLDTLFKDED